MTDDPTRIPRGDLVLVPGSGCDQRLYQHQIATLEPRTRIHLVDNTRHDRIERLAADSLQTLPDTFALAGLSQGGLIALEILRQAPDRVTRLALLDTLPAPGRSSDAVLHRLAIAMITLRMFGPIEAMMWPRYVHPDRLTDRPLRKLVGDMMRANGAAGLVNQQKIFITRPDYRPLLPDISVPTLVLVGAGDTLAPPDAARATAAAIPGSRLLVIPDAGHLTTLEAPEAVAEALSTWLTRSTPPPKN